MAASTDHKLHLNTHPSYSTPFSLTHPSYSPIHNSIFEMDRFSYTAGQIQDTINERTHRFPSTFAKHLRLASTYGDKCLTFIKVTRMFDGVLVLV